MHVTMSNILESKETKITGSSQDNRGQTCLVCCIDIYCAAIWMNCYTDACQILLLPLHVVDHLSKMIANVWPKNQMPILGLSGNASTDNHAKRMMSTCGPQGISCWHINIKSSLCLQPEEISLMRQTCSLEHFPFIIGILLHECISSCIQIMG